MDNKIRFHRIAAILSMFVTMNAKALTLDEALNEAITKSPLIEKSKSATEEAKWKKLEGRSGFLPTVSANANYLFSKKYALTNVRLGAATTDTIVPQIIPTGQLTLGISYPLFEGFTSVNKFSAGKESFNAATNEQKWNEFKIEMDVTLAYYKTLASKTLRDVAAQNLKALQDHLKDVKLFKSSGISTNYDVLRVEVQVSNAETDLLNAEDNISITAQKLNELLGKDSLENEVIGNLPVLDERTLNQIDKANIYNRFDLVAMKQRATALSYAEHAQDAYWVPRLSVYSAYQYYNNLNNSFTSSDQYRSAYQVGLQLSWNIFDGAVSFSRAKQMTEQVVQAEKSYRITELKAQADFEIWKRKFNYYASLYKARANDILRSRESVRLAREGVRVGARTNTEMLDAEADLYKAQAGTVNAQLGAIEALINLQTSIGQKIYTF